MVRRQLVMVRRQLVMVQRQIVMVRRQLWWFGGSKFLSRVMVMIWRLLAMVWRKLTHSHTLGHTLILTHTHRLTNSHSHTHTQTQTHIPINSHTPTHTNTLTQTHTHTRTNIYIIWSFEGIEDPNLICFSFGILWGGNLCYCSRTANSVNTLFILSLVLNQEETIDISLWMILTILLNFKRGDSYKKMILDVLESIVESSFQHAFCYLSHHHITVLDSYGPYCLHTKTNKRN